MISLYLSFLLSFIILLLGIVSLLLRRDLLLILISLEIMINSAVLALIVSGSYWGQVDGQIMYILAITVAASEASIILALLIRLYQRYQLLDIDILSEMRK